MAIRQTRTKKPLVAFRARCAHHAFLYPWDMTDSWFIVILVGTFALSRFVDRPLFWLWVRWRLSTLPGRAPANIVRTWSTGVRINGNPRVGFELEVRPPNGPAFRTRTVQTVGLHRLGQIVPDSMVTVAYNPKNPGKVIIIETGAIEDGAARRNLVESV